MPFLGAGGEGIDVDEGPDARLLRLAPAAHDLEQAVGIHVGDVDGMNGAPQGRVALAISG